MPLPASTIMTDFTHISAYSIQICQLISIRLLDVQTRLSQSRGLLLHWGFLCI